MHSLASAAKLLETCNSSRAAAPVLAMLGFDAELIPLSADLLGTLGVEERLERPHLARGAGALRALVFEPAQTPDVREQVSAVSRRLASSSPQLLWLIVTCGENAGEVAIAAVDGSAPRARVAALVVSRARIVDSDSETLCAMAAAKTASDLFTHCRWVEILGRESVNRRFFRTLEQTVTSLAGSLEPRPGPAESGELALLYVSRLLFLSFLETKGWLDRDHGFLANRYADCMTSGGRYHRRVLAPLFFGTLNTAPRNRSARAHAFGRIPFLNGGLFARSPLERRTAECSFSDEALGDLFGNLLTRYRFTAREDTTTWSEAAIDPEMLGKAFECLMSSRDRKKSGAFYTPQSLVDQVSICALSHCLDSPEAALEDLLAGAKPSQAITNSLLGTIGHLKILDPACGSGAFLVFVLEQLSRIRVQLGDTTPLHEIRRRILTDSIFGVDVNPTAVWLCELRLWLSMAIEDPESDPMRVTPLPNLDRNIRVGDSLSGPDFREPVHTPGGSAISRFRSRYARASGPRKRSLARALDIAERSHAVSFNDARVRAARVERRELLGAARSRDLFGKRSHLPSELLQRLDKVRDNLRQATAESRQLSSGGALPFSFVSGFADVAARGGFDVVVGNPPWVRAHKFDKASRVLLRRAFDVFRNSAWRGGSEAASAGRGFASQVDAAALFIERSVELLRPGGVAALIVPSKLWRSLAGGGVRDFLLRRTVLHGLHDLSEAAAVFDAAVYPSIVVARRVDDESPSMPISVSVHRNGQLCKWTAWPGDLSFDSSRGSPWLLIPPQARRAFDDISAAGVPLCSGVIGRPLLGVKTGCNDAFLVRERARSEDGSLTLVHNACRERLIETNLLRPAIRGDAVTRWIIHRDDARIIWTHDASGTTIPRLPPHAKAWLGAWRRDLEARTDSRGAKWWGVFRIDGARASHPRVIWPDIGRAPKAAVLCAGDPSVPINTCYVARCPTFDDACALATLINSDLAAAWLGAIAEPARGGYNRYMGWTMALLPLPRDWPRARELLAPIARCAMRNDPPDSHTLRAAVLDAYGLEESQVAALLAWSG